jgi:hypothetical protein
MSAIALNDSYTCIVSCVYYTVYISNDIYANIEKSYYKSIIESVNKVQGVTKITSRDIEGTFTTNRKYYKRSVPPHKQHTFSEHKQWCHGVK